MVTVILVGVDGTDSSRLAARRAAELAVRLGAELHVLSAVEQATVEEFPDRPGASQLTSGELAETIAAEVAQDLRSVVPNVTSRPLHGKPATALVDEAIRLDASLIVVGNRRVQGVGRLLGSVASSVAAHAPCDVYIVKTV
ncbi:universal stress protein [Pedococcus sp. 5OH_020]|uniref:universal stress protein n=1 Tax=Pedococcus sp. 5OH_020 TaxID=2989814 RepID=UPI0022E9D2AA|nr:universal stress protein [Pedococcus sp. 5OH_020]